MVFLREIILFLLGVGIESIISRIQVDANAPHGNFLESNNLSINWWLPISKVIRLKAKMAKKAR